jgi:putative oxidoreductase
MSKGVMQRLFSTFANGWPGLGLLLQRMLTTILLVRLGVFELTGASFSTSMIPQLIASFAGILLLAGLWTPVVGTLIAVIEIWVAVSRPGDPWISIVLATLGATAAMIGPGAWSLDARLFGRKHMTM